MILPTVKYAFTHQNEIDRILMSTAHANTHESSARKKI